MTRPNPVDPAGWPMTRATRANSGETGVTFHGRFEILFLSGSFSPPLAPPGTMSLTIFLTGGTRSGNLRSNFKRPEKGFSKDHKSTRNPLWRHVYETAETWLEAYCSCIQAQNWVRKWLKKEKASNIMANLEQQIQAQKMDYALARKRSSGCK